jgi:hypothetical protein
MILSDDVGDIPNRSSCIRVSGWSGHPYSSRKKFSKKKKKIKLYMDFLLSCRVEGGIRYFLYRIEMNVFNRMIVSILIG